MDNLDVLPVRFHLGGRFDFDGNSVNYVGGRIAMSHLGREKVSLPELRGFLGDHITLNDEHGVYFHWLFPGSELSNGLRLLSDDQTCTNMSNCITQCGVAKIYVEVYNFTGDDSVVLCSGEPAGCNGGLNIRQPIIVTSPHKEQHKKDTEFRQAFYSSPKKNSWKGNDSNDEEEDNESCDEQEKGDAHDDEDSDSSDSDYVQGDEDTSEDDEEAQKMREHAKQVKKNPCASYEKENVVVRVPVILQADASEDEGLDDDSDTPYMDSSEEASYDDAEDGEATRRKSRYPKYDSKAHIPKFAIGMRFRGRDKFKKGLIKYGLAT